MHESQERAEPEDRSDAVESRVDGVMTGQVHDTTRLSSTDAISPPAPNNRDPGRSPTGPGAPSTAATERVIRISLTWDVDDNEPTTVATTWSQLADALRDDLRPTACVLATCLGKECEHKHGRCWLPATFAGLRRAKCAITVSVLILDMDDLTEALLARVRELLSSQRYVLHASHSDRPGKRRVRVVLDLSRDMTPEEYVKVWHVVNDMLEEVGLESGTGKQIDTMCAGVQQPYYLPSRPSDACHSAEDGSGYLYESHDGIPLDVDQILHDRPLDKSDVAPDSEPMEIPEFAGAPEPAKYAAAVEALGSAWPSSGRHGAHLALAGALARCGWPEDLIARFAGDVAEHQERGNRDPAKRRDAARRTVERAHAGDAIQGWPTLVEHVGEDACREVKRHLGIRDLTEISERMRAWADRVQARQRATPVANANATPPPTADPDTASTPPPFAPPSTPPPVGAYLNGSVRLADALMRDCYWDRETSSPTLRRWRGSWYLWRRDRGCYSEISHEVIERDAYREGADKRAAVAEVRAAMIALDNVLISETALGCWIGDDSAAPSLDAVACPNGIVHLPTLQIIPPSPNYFATSALGCAYDPAAAAPKRWLAFLSDLWPGEPDAITTLQEWYGYCLTPDTRQHKIMMLVGPKRSGKGTIGRVLAALLGSGAVAAPTLSSLATNFGLWPLIGKSLALIGDARLGGRADASQVVERLLSISGQDPQTVDRKHLEPWTGYLSTRIMLLSNELPRLGDASGALASRMLILELSRSWLGSEDTSLTEGLLGELPGILLWAIEGWRRLRDRGRFAPPASSQDAADELADIGSPIAAWAREALVSEPARERWVSCDDAYNAFRRWCDGQGIESIPTSTVFGRDLKAATQCRRVQLQRRGKSTRCYSGFALAPR